MSWEQYRKGQAVSFRVNGGWKKGLASEIYADSISVTYSVGSADRTARIYDLRNIKPWESTNNKQASTLNEQLSFDS
jgi:plasmid replication initiation protein